MEPHSIHFEHYIEMLRMLEFPEEHSRFQSFFAFPKLEQAKDWAAGNEDIQIFKVEGDSYEKRDMNLLNINSFHDLFSKGRKYWRGEKSENPDWEVLIEPPVEVVEKVELE
jgi:hypothetical protein